MSTVTAASVAVLPAPVQRTLARLGAVLPQEAGDAARALAEAMTPVASSRWPEVAWRSSRLTGTGLPVEMAWASRDTALRWTSEVAGPEVPEDQRLGYGAAAALALGGSPIDVGPWADLQRGQPLRWGAWLGVRHRAGKRSAKVYVELPEGTVPSRWAELCRTVTARTGTLTWRMAGCSPDGCVELYARAPALTLPALAAAGHLVGRGEELVRLATALAIVVPRSSGLSVVVGSDGSPRAVTWFAFAKALWSSDAAATRRVAELCTTEVRAAPGSAALHRALTSGADDGRWRHGMVGVGVDLAGDRWLQAGLRPT